jgi:hypothetical protein
MQKLRHASERWHPESAYRPIFFKPWIPAFAGMTM